MILVHYMGAHSLTEGTLCVEMVRTYQHVLHKVDTRRTLLVQNIFHSHHFLLLFLFDKMNTHKRKKLPTNTRRFHTQKNTSIDQQRNRF